MIYEIVLEFEKSERYPLSEITENVDHSNYNPLQALDNAFVETQNEKVKKHISPIKFYLGENNISYELKIVKILPKYLQENIDIINFRVIFQIKIEKNIKQKSFIKKYSNKEFQTIKDNIPGAQRIIKNLDPIKVYIKQKGE